MNKNLCSSCAFLVKKKQTGSTSCQVVNPGQTTQIENPEDEDLSCPKWEKATLKSSSYKRRNNVDDVIIYDIIK